MSLVLGFNAVTAENTGSTVTPVWVIVPEIRDETVNLETALSDVTTRASNGFRLQVPTLSDGTVDTQILYDTESAAFQKFQTAYFNRSMLLMYFADADPDAAGTTVQGLYGGFGISNFSLNRALEEAVMVDITFQAREDDAGNGPQWLTIVNP